MPIFNVPPLQEMPPLDTGLRQKVKRKPLSDNNNDTVADCFGVREPAILESTRIKEFLVHHPHLMPREPYPMAVPKTLIGIEVEAENVLKIDPNVSLLFWQAKADGSLRNHGVEFVTPGALPSAYAEPALKQLFEGFNPDVDFSSRTSIHIHLDVRQLTLQQSLGLLLTYSALENVLFKFVGLNRRTNIFCVPITEAGLLEHLTDQPVRVLHSIDQYWSKYTALNLLPMVTLGTMEFRHMPGTKNIGHILTWIDLIGRMKRHAYRYSFQNIVNQIAQLNNNSMYKQFIDLVFADAASYLDCSHLQEDMEKPVFLVKNSMISNDFHRKVITSKCVEHSQFYDYIYGWKVNLSKSQCEALEFLCMLWDKTDQERIFKDLITRPEIYLKTYPNVKNQIVAVLQPTLKTATKESRKKSAQAMLSYGAITANDYQALIDNGDLI